LIGRERRSTFPFTGIVGRNDKAAVPLVIAAHASGLQSASLRIPLDRHVVIIDDTMRRAFKIIVLAASHRPPECQTNQHDHYYRQRNQQEKNIHG
jgi:hypothetical protein